MKSNFDKKKDLRFQVYKKIFQSYSSFFHEQLFHEDNKAALDYLSNRGFNKFLRSGLSLSVEAE